MWRPEGAAKRPTIMKIMCTGKNVSILCTFLSIKTVINLFNTSQEYV